MSYIISVHRKAEQEYDVAYNWYSQEKKGLEEQFFDAVSRKLYQISTRPELFSVKGGSLRAAMVTGFPYTIFYRINKRAQIITVIAIHHTSRKPVKKYNR